MCIKVNLRIKLEVLPVVYHPGVSDPTEEPFALFRPNTRKWELGYARRHRDLLAEKNASAHGNFIPMIKVLKHLRDRHGAHAVSFHIESLLYNISDDIFFGSPAQYIARVLKYVAELPLARIFQSGIMTPCRDRELFSPTEWTLGAFASFYSKMRLWAQSAEIGTH